MTHEAMLKKEGKKREKMCYADVKKSRPFFTASFFINFSTARDMKSFDDSTSTSLTVIPSAA